MSHSLSPSLLTRPMSPAPSPLRLSSSSVPSSPALMPSSVVRFPSSHSSPPHLPVHPHYPAIPLPLSASQIRHPSQPPSHLRLLSPAQSSPPLPSRPPPMRSLSTPHSAPLLSSPPVSPCPSSPSPSSSPPLGCAYRQWFCLLVFALLLSMAFVVFLCTLRDDWTTRGSGGAEGVGLRPGAGLEGMGQGAELMAAHSHGDYGKGVVSEGAKPRHVDGYAVHKRFSLLLKVQADVEGDMRRMRKQSDALRKLQSITADD